uniref:Coiled-coil domain containing 32 n=2 Tax=Ornithorhynchus anatinus TaxID=9258 RepID=A0A6I8P9K9_ORNAN
LGSPMKMFESTDGAAARSGQDLWAEICSRLPDPDREDVAGDTFADSFADSNPQGGDGGQGADFSSKPAAKPWAPLQDSDIYLASLERRLRRVKGLSQEVTSKEMLRTLARAKEEYWDRFLQEKLESEVFVDGLDADESTLEHFRRWLQPDKVAVSTEEVQCLIPPDPPAEKAEAGHEATPVDQ